MPDSNNIQKELKKHFNAENTGALFVVLSNQKLMQIFFQNGEIESIKYQGLTGKKAFDILNQNEPTKFQFHPGVTSRFKDNLPPTKTILDWLQDKPETSFYVKGNDVRPMIHECLISCIGPIADVLFSNHVSDAKNINELIQNITQSLDDSNDRDAFLKKVSQMLDQSPKSLE